MKRFIAAAALLLMAPAMAPAQNANPPYRGQGYLFFGLGPGTGGYWSANTLIKQVGFGGEGFLYKGLGAGAEASYASWRTRSTAWIGSGDFSYHFRRHAARLQVDPFVLGGVSIVGPTQVGGGRGSPAGNFGGGANLWLAPHAALRFDFRDVVGADFWGYTHVIAFRIGMTFR